MNYRPGRSHFGTQVKTGTHVAAEVPPETHMASCKQRKQWFEKGDECSQSWLTLKKVDALDPAGCRKDGNPAHVPRS